MHPDLEPIFRAYEPRRELVLELWRIDLSGENISRLLGYAEPSAITRIVSSARGIGDPRAVARAGYGGRGGRRTHLVRSGGTR